MNPESTMWIAIGLATLAGSGMLTALFLGPIGRAIGRRIQGRMGESIPGDLADQLQELPDVAKRLQELEDRVDFAERLLSSVGAPEDEVSGRHP